MRTASTTLAIVACLACNNAPILVSRIVSPAEASRAQGTKLRSVAVLRGEGRAELPANAIVEPTRVRVPQTGPFDYALDSGEKVLRDDKAVITGVETPGNPPIVTAFRPGTAELDETHKLVRGELATGEQRLPLMATDHIEVRGTFASGEEIPLGGRVEQKRATSALVFGSVLFLATYIPSAYVGISSPKGYDGGLLVPVFGPWIAYFARPDCISGLASPCASAGIEKFAIALDGVTQAIGVLVFAVGLPTHTEVVDLPDSTQKTSAVRVRPTFGLGRLGLSGEF